MHGKKQIITKVQSFEMPLNDIKSNIYTYKIGNLLHIILNIMTTNKINLSKIYVMIFQDKCLFMNSTIRARERSQASLSYPGEDGLVKPCAA